MSNILAYIKERFSIIPVLLFAFGYAALGTGVSPRSYLSDTKQLVWTIVIFASIFTFFLLRQRVVDEFKDSSHDLKNFPDRPVPRGLITKSQLILLGLGALIAEWSLVYLLGLKALLAYLPVFAYSLLMAKEFFVSKWLNHHFNLYLLSHEVIFILFGIFFLRITNIELAMTGNSFLALGVLLTAPFSVEIVRKFSPRYDKKGEAVQDTYSTVWGRGVAITVLLLLGLSTGLFLTIIKNSYLPFLLSAFLSLTAIMLGKKSDKIVTLVGSVNFLGLAFLSNIVW